MTISLSSLRIALLTASSLLVLGTAQPALAEMGFSISVDGTHVAGDPIAPDTTRETDRRLANADIRVTFDGLGVRPSLNVLPLDRRSVYRAGETVRFQIDTNYGPWIARSEVRIYESGSDQSIAVVPAGPAGGASWQMPETAGSEFYYVARVYDRSGRFDETQALPLWRGERTEADAVDLPVWGDDRTARRAIAVEGGLITVHGRGLPTGGRATVLGENVPIDADGDFVIQRILPTGEHSIDIALDAPRGEGMVFTRDINIPSEDWFYVGMADLTLGKRWGDGRLVDAAPGEFDDFYAKGRLAFYLKGKIKGEYLLTAAADTGEGPLSELFNGMLSSDPQAVLRRIDPNQYYPVYGDDSTMVDDAPTRGKFFVRLERGPNQVMWGNFRTVVGNSKLLRSERALYGASAHIEADSVNERGNPLYLANVYAAQPGTLPARDVLRATGGSAYVLRRQDLVPGSETVTIEKRNANTGLVISSTRLRAGVDYTINYMQGVIVLTRPLAGMAATSGAVQSSSSDIVDLVAQYEFSPPNTDLGDFAYGGTAALQLGEAVSVGVVGMAETVRNGQDLRIYGANIRIAPTERSFLEAEILRSDGSASASWLSTDGGLTYIQQPSSGNGADGHAYRLAGQVALDELVAESFQAIAGFTLEGQTAGFSTLERQALHDTLAFSGYVRGQVNEDLGFAVKYDHIDNATGARRDELGAEISYRLSEAWSVELGLLHRDEVRPGGTNPTNGARTDLGARLTYGPSDDLSIYGFGQATLHHSAGYGRNDRIGIGADLALGEHWALGGEVSAGSTGPQALAMLSHETEPGKRSYVGLRVSPHASDDFYSQSKSINGVVLGSQQRLNEAVSVRAENTFGLFGDTGSATALYGVDLTHDAHWSSWGLYETGRNRDDRANGPERHSLSLGLAYKDDGIDWTNRGEIRVENAAGGSRQRTTGLLRSGLSIKTDDDWRLLAGIDGLISRSDQSAILDGDYVEASIGAAYRPVGHDRLNALIRYSYLYDLPGPDQVSRAGKVLGPAQKSHIFSVDANYDLTEYLTVGAKYGVRIGEVSTDRNRQAFAASTVHLGIVRADLAVLRDWKLLLEARALYAPQTEIVDFGALAGISYDVSEQVRLGVGYNFGQFSDDLRDLSHDDHGVFLNMTAKF